MSMRLFGETFPDYKLNIALCGTDRLRTYFSAASERCHIRVKLRPGQVFLRSISFPWVSLHANHFRTWLKGGGVKAAPDTDWPRGSEQGSD